MKNTILLTEQDLPGLISPIVKQAVEEAFKKAKVLKQEEPNGDGEMLTLREAAKYLKISRSTLIALRKKGAFSAHPVANRHLFLRSDLDAYVLSKTI